MKDYSTIPTVQFTCQKCLAMVEYDSIITAQTEHGRIVLCGDCSNNEDTK